MVDLAIKNGKLVSPTEVIRAGIAVDKGKIVAIASEDYLPPANKTIDANGKYILPGVIDAHYHFGGRFQGLGESCKTESVAAAAGGTTTLGCFIIESKRSLLDVADEWQRTFEGVSAVDYFLHGSIVDELSMGDIPKCPAIGINSFKFLVGYKGPHAELLGIRSTDDGWIYRGFDAISKLGCHPVWAQVHAENADILLYIRTLVEGKRQDPAAWNDSRPNFVEAEAIKRCIAIAEYTNCPLYIVHNSIAEAIDIIKEAKNRGKIELKAETCPQYLTHNSEEPIQMFKDNPALIVVNPPLRDKESNERLWEGIRDGVIDIVASDNGFNTLAVKGKNIWKTPMAMGNIVEMVLPVMLSEGVNKGRISLQKVVEVLCFNPARIFGLFPKKGTIAVGSDADIVIVDLEKKVKVREKDSLSGCDWNIYEGWDFKGWPVMTILRGQIIIEDRKLVGTRIGQYVPCKCE